MGDYRQPWRTYGGDIVDKQLPAVDPVLIYANTSASRIAVQEIRFTPTTFAASVMTFVDSLTGIVLASISIPPARPDGDATLTASPGGVAGVKLSAGANLLLGTTNGAAGRLYVAAFQRPR